LTVETVYTILGSFVACWSAAALLYGRLARIDASLSALDERTKHHDRRITNLEKRP
jgi:hypothetical protein